MDGLFRYFVRHGVAANLLMLVAVCAGLYASNKIRKQFFPDVVIERITVRTTWDGAGPAEIDDAIIAVMEPGLRAIEGVDEVRTLARQNTGSIVLSFENGVDMVAAVDAVKAAIDVITTLPEDVEAPTITRSRFRDRVTNIVIHGDAPVTRLAGYADALKSALFADGVTRLTLRGLATADIHVIPREAALQRFGLTYREIATAIGAEIAARPAGVLDGEGSRVLTGQDRRDIAALRDLPIKSLSNGGVVTLSEIADFRSPGASALGADDAARFFVEGKPALELRVDRHASGDGVKIQAQVENIVEQIAQTLPEGVHFTLTRTRAQAITDRLDLLIRNGSVGLIIVVGLLFLFLSARTAFWVAAGIPVAMLSTLLIMHLAGMSLNMLSLFALIICLGIVVDDAIVVGEHADALARQGLSPSDAAATAASRMASPVFSASITTVIAFSALLAIGGRFGDWLLVLPMTVGIVMIASLVECFLILPAHMRHALASRERRSWIDAPSRWVNAGFDWFRRVIFRRLVATAMRLRYPVIAGAIAALLLSLTLQFSGQVRWFFIQFPERGTIQANIAMMPGADREDTFAMLAEMRRALQVANAHYAQKHGRAPVIDTVAILGGGTGRGLAAAETKDPDTLGGFEIELIDPDDRPYSAMAFIQTWRAQIKKHPLLETLALRGDRSGPGGDAIDIALSGLQAPDVLKKAAIRLQDLLAALPGVSALEDSMPYDKPERILILTPKGRALGFTTDAIAAELRARLEGVSAAIFPYGEQEARVMVVGPDTASRVSALYNIRLISANGITAPLSDIVDIMEQPSFASVKRLDGKVVVTVNGDIVEDAETRAFVSSELTSRILPAIEAAFGVETEQGGLARQERDFLSDAMVGFYACLIGIYATLAWVFRSWSRPVIVLLAIPFGYVGAVWGHYWMGVALSMFSVVGLIGMAGIIINDSIVLITAIDERMRRQPVFEAVVDGVLDRFRAVLLTTLTTVGGLAPLLYETSRQAIFLKPTVITLAFGLAFGMVIVLFVTPAMVLASQDISRRLVAFRHLRRWLFSRRRWRLGGERSTLRQ